MNRELREAAAQMEQEMKSSSSMNAHVLEERGVRVNGTEEELYSKVHVNEPAKSNRRYAPPKEEKVLSRAIMKPAPKEPMKEPMKEPVKEPVKETPKSVKAPMKESPKADKPSQPVITSPKLVPKNSEDHKKDTSDAIIVFSFIELNAAAPEFVCKPVSARMVPVMANPMMNNQVMHVFIPPNQMMVRGQMMPVQMVPAQMVPAQQGAKTQSVSPQQSGVTQTVSPQQPVIPGQPVLSTIPVYPMPYQMMRPVYPVGGNQFVPQPQAYQVVASQPPAAVKSK